VRSAPAPSCLVLLQSFYSQVNAQQLLSTGFKYPVVLQPLATPAATAAALGLALPPGFSLHSLREGLGGQHSVPVMDVATQEMWPDMSMDEVREIFYPPPPSLSSQGQGLWLFQHHEQPKAVHRLAVFTHD
jgi:hypothetical protein